MHDEENDEFDEVEETWFSNLEILGPAKSELPPLPEDAYDRERFPTLIFTNDHQLMFFTWKKCWVLRKCNNKVQWVYPGLIWSSESCFTPWCRIEVNLPEICLT